MNYLKYTFVVGEDLVDELIAQVGELPFDTFEDTETGFAAYIPESAVTSEVDTALQLLLLSYDLEAQKELIVGQNWNALWESNFEPILIDQFCAIRAEFHPHFTEFDLELTIAPKMAFGTGHHETTHMMIQNMKNLDFKNKKVLDYGCGTGILAMVASKLDAKWVDAVDHEFPAYENTIEHNEMNGVTNVTAIHGTLEDVGGKDYEIVLANINRNVILENLDLLVDKVKYGCHILFSGFLQEDEAVMTDAFRKKDLIVQKVNQRGKWLCIHAQYLPSSVAQDKTEGFDRFPDVHSEKSGQQVVSVATEKNQITFQKEANFALKMTLINAQMIQIRYQNVLDPEPEFSYAIDENFVKNQGLVDYKLVERDSYYEITTTNIRVQVSKEKLKLSFFDPNSQLIIKHSEIPTQLKHSIQKGYYSCQTNFEIAPDTTFYGLGDKTGALALNGTKYTNWCVDAFGYSADSNELYRAIPFFTGQKLNTTFGFFLDNPYRSHFDFGATKPDLLSFGADGGELNYYFFAGETQLEVIQQYTQLTGLAQLPPIWALGYHQCRWSYFPESRVLEVAEQFRKEEIPCDAIYLDIDYMEDFKCFTWNKTYFPNPREKTNRLKSMGFQTVVMIDPGIKVQPGYPIFEDGLRRNAFCRRSNGQLMIGPVWPSDCVFPDFTDPEVRDWWGTCYQDLYERDDISGFWNDMNEPAVFKVDSLTFPNEVLHHFEGHPTNHAKAHNVYGMLMAKASQEGLLKIKPNKRPFLLTRSNFSGGQRYAAIWTGDNVASWEHLRLANVQMQRLAMSGYSFTGSDIGGFVDQPEPELMVRWMQLAVFHAVMRTHFMGNKDHGSAEVDILQILAEESSSRVDREPWSFGPETTILLRKAINLRYQLLGLLYTGMHAYSQNGTPLLQPLVMDHCEIDDLPAVERDFMFGQHLLVSPVLEAGLFEQSLYLPKGDWYDFHSDAHYQGGETVTVAVQAEHLPIFVRAGAVLPIYPVRQHTGMPVEQLQIQIYYGTDAVVSTFYEDDGEGYSHQNGNFRLTTFQYRHSEGQTTIQSTSTGHYLPSYTSQQITLIGFGDGTQIFADNQLIVPVVDENRFTFELQNDWKEIWIGQK